MLRIDKLFVKNVNNLKEIEINFNEHFNIICGQNGTGKTTLLNCLLGSFKKKKLGSLNVNAMDYHGFWEIKFYNNNEPHYRVHYIDTDVNIKDNLNIKGDKLISTNYIISFSVNNRNMTNQLYGSNPLKTWLYKNYFVSDLNYSKERNFSLVKECFSMIDPSISFGDVQEVFNERKASKNPYNRDKHFEIEIYVETSKGRILIDHMSSGYQSVLMILLSLIKKVESLEQYGSNVHNFMGVLLIDEIDLYLHPEWQKKLIEIIRWLLPNAQIITTTHSPHIIQSARPGEIIPLGFDDNGNTFIRDLPESNEYGYQGWTIEEILNDVMGLNETRSHRYKDAIKKFDIAIDNEVIDDARNEYYRLESMLHPNNHTLKLLKIQMASLGGLENDKY